MATSGRKHKKEPDHADLDLHVFVVFFSGDVGERQLLPREQLQDNSSENLSLKLFYLATWTIV